MDGESEPNPAIAEEAEERVDPMNATPTSEQQATPPSEEATEAVSMDTKDGATKEGSTEDNDDDVVLVGEEAPQPSATTLSQDTPSTDCLEPAAAEATVELSTAAMPAKTSGPPASSSASTVATPPKTPTTAEPIVIDDEEDSEQKDTSTSSPLPPGGSSAPPSPGVLSSTEPDSEIRIASVTTLGSSSQKGSAPVSAVNSPPHPVDVEADMNLMITSVTSLQEAAVADTAVRINTMAFVVMMQSCKLFVILVSTNREMV